MHQNLPEIAVQFDLITDCLQSLSGSQSFILPGHNVPTLNASTPE